MQLLLQLMLTVMMNIKNIMNLMIGDGCLYYGRLWQ